MAVTAGGTPYVESSDLVANYPGASLALANRVDQVMQAPTQNAITSTTYTAALLDAGKTVTLSNASAVTLTIPAQATVSWADNTQLNFLNLGAGTVTIAAGAGVTINGTPLTLATSKGGSLVRTASNTWTFTPTGGGGGKVLQVVEGTTSTDVDSTSTTFVDTTLTATITPSSASSKILVIFHQNGCVRVSGTTTTGIGLRLMRDATSLGVLAYYAGFTGTSLSVFLGTISGSKLDSPATTSAVVYKTQFKNQTAGGAEVTVQNGGFTESSITLIEVAA